MPGRFKLPRLTVRREKRCLTLSGKLLVGIAVVAAFIGLARGLYPFLAVDQPLGKGTLVMDGWMPAFMIGEVAKRFSAASYDSILVVRPLQTAGSLYQTDESVARLVSESLAAAGVPPGRIHTVYFEPAARDRTLLSAQAARKWLQARGESSGSIDVVTLGPHARRSRLLFEFAFGKAFQVGVLAVEDQTFDGRHWWKSSRGIREVPFEFIAYLHVRFLFSTGTNQ